MSTIVMEHAKPKHRGYYLLPNMMTMASLFVGFVGMLWSLEGRFEMAAVAVLGSCLFDGLDGKLARLTNSASDFGVQLDSLADLVAFGVAPALMAYQWHLHAFDRLGMMASFLIIACGALRLARFNVQTGKISKKFFIGLPIPAGACILAAFVLFAHHLGFAAEPWAAKALLALAFVVSLLMVSAVRYFSFKEMDGLRTHRFSATVTALFLFVLIASEPKLLLFICGLGYLLSGLIYSFVVLPLRRRSLRLRDVQRLS